MKTVIENYGRAILATVIVIALFGLILAPANGKGILSVLAENSKFFEDSYTNWDTDKKNEAASSYVAIADPQISLNKIIPTGKTVNLYNYINVKIYKENLQTLNTAVKDGLISCKINRIVSSDGNAVSNNNGEVKLDAGSYKLTVTCWDIKNSVGITSTIFFTAGDTKTS